MKKQKYSTKISLPIIICFATIIGLLLLFIKTKTELKKVDSQAEKTATTTQATQATPTKIPGIGYDPTLYPIQTYENKQFEFSFEYQKGEVKSDSVSGKELSKVNLIICTGACSTTASVSVLPFNNLRDALIYRTKNDPNIKVLNMQYVDTLDATVDQHPAKVIQYKYGGSKIDNFGWFSYYDVIVTRGNYSYSVAGKQAKEVANTLKFTN